MRSWEMIIAAAQDRRHLGRAVRFGGADVGFRRVDLFVRRFDIGIAVQRDRDRVLGGGGQVRQLRRRQIGRHTSELQSLMRISYAVFCLKKKKNLVSGSNSYKRTRQNNNRQNR